MVSLDFQPQNPPPKALPSCLWNGIVLWKGSNDLPPVDLSAQPFHEAFRGIFEGVGFCDLAQVLESLSTSDTTIDKDALFAAYNFRYGAKLERSLQTLKTLPREFIKWARERSVSPADIYPLCTIDDIQRLAASLNKLSELQLSRSQGAQLIELLAECALLGSSDDVLLQHSGTFATWIPHLQTIRYPQTTNRETERQQRILVGWPKAFATRWLRQGDRSGIEVKFFVSTKKELAEKISTLTRVHDGMSDE